MRQLLGTLSIILSACASIGGAQETPVPVVQVDKVSAQKLAADLAKRVPAPAMVIYEGWQDEMQSVLLPNDPDEPRHTTNAEGVHFVIHSSRVGWQRNDYTKTLVADPKRASIAEIERETSGTLHVMQVGDCLVVQDADLQADAAWPLNQTLGAAVKGPATLADALKLLEQHGKEEKALFTIEPKYIGDTISEGFTADATVRDVLLAVLRHVKQKEHFATGFRVRPSGLEGTEATQKVWTVHVGY